MDNTLPYPRYKLVPIGDGRATFYKQQKKHARFKKVANHPDYECMKKYLNDKLRYRGSDMWTAMTDEEWDKEVRPYLSAMIF